MTQQAPAGPGRRLIPRTGCEAEGRPENDKIQDIHAQAAQIKPSSTTRFRPYRAVNAL